MNLISYEEAKRKQDDLVRRGFSLSHWYGVWCDKCCGVYPYSMICGHQADEKMFYQCEVCGKRTAEFDMPWQARDAWNAGQTFYEECQMQFCF